MSGFLVTKRNLSEVGGLCGEEFFLKGSVDVSGSGLQDLKRAVG